MASVKFTSSRQDCIEIDETLHRDYRIEVRRFKLLGTLFMFNVNSIKEIIGIITS